MRKFKNATEALEDVRGRYKNGQPYTPVQVYNSAQRSEAWARKSGNVIQRAIWGKVVREAEAAVAEAYAKAAKKKVFIPCDANCMGSLSPDCNCHCGGVNHSIHAGASVAHAS